MITKTSLVQTPLIEKKSVIVNGPPSQIVPPTSPPRYETRSLIINPGKPPLIPNQTIIRSASPSPRRSAREFENDLNTKLKMEIDRLCFVLQQKEEELNSFKAKCAHLEGHLSSPHQSPRNLSRLQNLEDKINVLLMENQKLNHLANNKEIEIESWRSRSAYNEMAFQDAKILSARIKDLELRNGSLLEELEKWKINYYDLERSRSQDEHHKRSAFKDKEVAESEMKNLHHLVKMKETEIEDLKFKYRQLENNNRDGRNLEQKLVILSGDYEKLQRMYQERSKEYEVIKHKNLSLEASFHELKMRQDRNQEYENRIGLLSTEITRLNSILKEKSEEVESWRMRYSKLEYSTKEIHVFENEMHRTRELLELRNREIQELKARCLKYESSITDMKSSHIRVKENEDRVSLYMADIERLNNTIRAKNQEIERLEFTINHRQGIEKEIIALKEINEIRLKEIEELRIKCQRMDESSFDMRNRQSVFMDYENKIVMLSTELERVNHLLRIKNEEVQNLMIQTSRFDVGGIEHIRDLEGKIDFLNAEIERLNIIIENQNREIHATRVSVVRDSGLIQSQNFAPNGLVGALTRENEDLRRSLFEKDMEMNSIQRSKFGLV